MTSGNRNLGTVRLDASDDHASGLGVGLSDQVLHYIVDASVLVEGNQALHRQLLVQGIVHGSLVVEGDLSDVVDCAREV